MTNPGGPTGITPGDWGVDGSGSIPSLVSRTQANVEAALKAQVETSPPWVSAASTFFGTILDGFDNAADLIQNRVNAFLADITAAITGIGSPSAPFLDIKNWAIDRPAFSQVPLGSALSKAISANEDVTFDRAALNGGGAAATASASGPGSHVHNMTGVPEYQPLGFGGNLLEIGYIRALMDREYTQVAFITGSALIWAGITALYIGVYRVDSTTGDLTLVNTTMAAVDQKSALVATKTQYVLPLGLTISAAQNEVFAVATLQVTNGIQSCSSLMCTTLTDIDGASVTFPRKQYCFAGPYTSMPSTISESDLDYSVSDKLPFYALG